MDADYGIYTAMVNDTIAKLERKEGLPNIPFIRQKIREAKKSIKTLENGSAFCADMEMLEKTEKALKANKDKLAAFKAILDYVNARVNANK